MFPNEEIMAAAEVPHSRHRHVRAVYGVAITLPNIWLKECVDTTH